jgi:hypothetical protein
MKRINIPAGSSQRRKERKGRQASPNFLSFAFFAPLRLCVK